MQRFTSFRQFWPYYLQEHARVGTRVLHYIGTSLVLLIAVLLVASGDWRMLPILPIAGYGFAWAGHALVERNRPATFRHPLWSLGADFLLWYRFVMGQSGHDLRQAGVIGDGVIDPARRL
ncbi:DUF962 domain-containing protein [Sphingobium aquiterrae]|uniref:DUF962 domain-containing protein n=1 Tax=Sphingobium aquiterrae TaxID=2038656 RepID=UPI003017B790